ncbi:hypothetical protein [Streptomyces youssoufiensis]
MQRWDVWYAVAGAAVGEVSTLHDHSVEVEPAPTEEGTQERLAAAVHELSMGHGVLKVAQPAGCPADAIVHSTPLEGAPARRLRLTHFVIAYDPDPVEEDDHEETWVPVRPVEEKFRFAVDAARGHQLGGRWYSAGPSAPDVALALRHRHGPRPVVITTRAPGDD